MRGSAIILSALLLTAACKPATEDVTAPIPEPASERATTPAADAGPRQPDPPEVFPVPPGAACDVRGGWSEDKDPAGLNVRAGPSAAARIVGRLPPPRYDPDFEREMKADFDILEIRDGWVRIGMKDPDSWSPAYPKPPAGWISGRYVGFDLQSDKAFVEPDPKSRLVASAREGPQGIMPFSFRNPSECRGRWVKLLVTDRQGRESPAWARGVCNSQETTCDGGAEGDYFEPPEHMPGWTGP